MAGQNDPKVASAGEEEGSDKPSVAH
jgi:hypothetical protein